MGADGAIQITAAEANNATYVGARAGTSGIPAHVRSALEARFRTYPWVKRVILFGSRARGDEGERSDIDLAVEAPGASERDWHQLYFAVEDLDTLLKIDMVRLEEVSDEFRRNILAQGVTVYERSKASTERCEPGQGA